MKYRYHSAEIEAAAKAVQAAMTVTRAEGIPFAATNAMHRALAALECADTEVREAQDNSQGGDFSA